MAEKWSPPDADTAVIAHISDLHFGAKNWKEVWDLASKYIVDTIRPHLLLITGDIVHSPKKKRYKLAKDLLDGMRIPYYLCAGNHDRFFFGNSLAVSNVFLGGKGMLIDQVFKGLIPPHDNPTVLEVGSGQYKWRVGLLSIESSAGADISARGAVDKTAFETLRDATVGSDLDLCILLIHHHLLSIRKLELARRGKSLLDLTCLVNTGNVLETLSEARIDLALHGHEHSDNWGVYSSLGRSAGKVRIVAAGSITGNKSRGGANLSRASFNVMLLKRDRRGELLRLAYPANGWDVVDREPLLLTADVREACSRRKNAMVKSKGKAIQTPALPPPAPKIDSEIVKHVQFTREREVIVRWLYLNWPGGGRESKRIFCSPGVLDVANVTVLWWVSQDPSRHGELSRDQLSVEEGDEGWWKVSWPVPHTDPETSLTMELNYTWGAAAVLTDVELAHLKPFVASSLLRSEGLEHSCVGSSEPICAAELVLSIPRQYAPSTVQVRVLDENDQNVEAEAAQLVHAARHLAKGQFALRVPYPRTDRRYCLAWKPLDEKKLEQEIDHTGFAVAVRTRAPLLLQEFAGVLRTTSLNGHVTLALYADNGNSKTRWERADRLDISMGGAVTRPSRSNPPLDFEIGERSALGQAWCGYTVVFPERHSDDDARKLGFVPGETALVCVPIRYGMEWIAPAPAAILRIGVFDNAAPELLVADGVSDQRRPRTPDNAAPYRQNPRISLEENNLPRSADNPILRKILCQGTLAMLSLAMKEG